MASWRATATALLALAVALGGALWAQNASADILSPHMVYGYIQDSEGDPAGGCQVAITNLRTGDTATPADDANLTTDSEGRYSVDVNDPAIFPEGWLDGDGLRISAIGPSGSGQRDAEYLVSMGAQQVNLQLDPVEDEGPEDGGFPSWAYWTLGGGALLLLAGLAYWLLVPPKE